MPSVVAPIAAAAGPHVAAVLAEVESGLRATVAPGEGALPLRAFVKALPDAITIDVEVPMKRLADAGVTPLERARRAVEAARRYLC